MKALIQIMTIDDQFRTLERFNEKVDRLKQREFEEESKGGGTYVEWRKGQGWDGIHVGPSEKTVDATVFTLRFFILDNESTSLSNMAKLYSGLDIDPSISTKFFEVRNLVNSYLDTPSDLSISEAGPMTRREIFYLFINGGLAHANVAAKVEKYRAISQTPLFPLFQAEFTHTIRLFMLALNEIQRINCVALDQLRRGGTPP